MKLQKYIITLGFFLALMFQGCPLAKTNVITRDHNLTKESELTLISIYDLMVKHKYQSWGLNRDFDLFSIDDNSTKSKYALHLEVYDQYEASVIKEHTYATGYFPVVLKPCGLSLSYDRYDQYPIFTEGELESDYSPIYNIYFDIKTLQENGYIAIDPIDQKDLCLFLKDKQLNWNIISNTLVYDAQEINTLMEEYEALQ